MHWSHHKIIVAWTGAMVFLLSNIGWQIEGLYYDPSNQVNGFSANPSPSSVNHSFAYPRPGNQQYYIDLTFYDGASSGSQLVKAIHTKVSLPSKGFVLVS